MEEFNKVFTSGTMRAQSPIKNNLYELINVVPAVPITITKAEEICCDFKPQNGKQYQPKKRSKLKVKTVRDIRRVFEENELAYLPEEIEKQQDYLLKKIKAGSARDTQTKTTAKKILTCDKPLSRSSLQMLMTINPHDYTHNKQYVMYGGKWIRVNGSTGGKKLKLIDFDLSKKILIPTRTNKRQCKKTKVIEKRGLLRNSLAVNFKPGPLIKKVNLDDSYQKYNVGTTELVNIPKAGLTLQPSLGVALEPSISRVFHNFRNEDGTISEKWAEFSVTMLSTADNSNIVQREKESCVTFELNYKFDQKKLLMRSDIDRICVEPEIANVNESKIKHADPSETEIKKIMSQMLDSVEIGFIQDEICSHEVEPLAYDVDDFTKPNAMTNNKKEKKKKRFGELDKLDVTVIRLPDEELANQNELCQNSFCSLGCICPSLLNPCSIKQHCGRVECMFQCKCDFSKYAMDTLEDTGLLPGIINLDNEINLKLSKEQQKFHQTVVVNGDKSIVLKSQKRNCKASKRYADFYTEMSLSSKTDEKLRQDVSVVLTKLDCKSIEPWCMVHQLYKCFCKGKFTESAALINDAINHTKADYYPEGKTSEAKSDITENRKLSSSSSHSHDSKPIYIDDSSDMTDAEYDIHQSRSRCARAMIYSRKHKKTYYSQMNTKIEEMEKNDETLKKRMLQLMKAQLPEDENSASSTKELTSQVTVNKVQPHGENISYRLNDPTMNIHHQVKKSRRSTRHDGCAQINLELSKSEEELQKLPITHHTNEEMLDHLERHATENDLSVTKSVEEIDKQTTNPMGHEKIAKPPTKEPTENRAKLIAWLESSYQQYKKREQQGKIILDPPKNKKLVIYPWDFILSRYTEKKNVFLVTKNMPYRLFMAVDAKNNFFKNCINIDDIRKTDLNKYPVTVQKLLTNAPNFNDNFCILCGLHCCWEFVGSVSKLRDRTSSTSALSDSTHTSNAEDQCESLDTLDTHMDVDDYESDDSKKDCKWFVLTVEEDFTEIQFCERGFFVKHESILKAANVARMSGKTVRLSSQKNLNQNVGPQFGIYVIPHPEEYCAFIGPYKKEDCLGLNIVKSYKYFSKISKGFWLTTKIQENYKVIDDPMSYLRLMTDSVEYVTLTNEPLKPITIPSTSKENTSKEADTTNNPKYDKTDNLTSVVTASLEEKQVTCKKTIEETPVVCKKTIKPITIRNTNGTFRLVPKPKGLLIRPSTAPSTNQSSKSIKIPYLSTGAERAIIKLPTSSNSVIKSSGVILVPSKEIKKPIAEIAPQIKIVDVYSESTAQQDSSRIVNQNARRGMFILKPEEINERLMKEGSIKAPTLDSNDTPHNGDQNLEQDIENFLATSTIFVPPNADMLMGSVEEQIAPEPQPQIKDVFIECNTIENLGWIRGKRNEENYLSFMFPGFVFTTFYPESEAFSKINQVLSRKVYVPSNLILEWRVVESEDQIKYKNMLSAEQLGLDFVLTKRGLRHKRDVMTYAKTLKSISLSERMASGATSSSSGAVEKEPEGEVEKATDLLNQQEAESQEIDKRNDELLREFRSISGEITDKLREEIADKMMKLRKP